MNSLIKAENLTKIYKDAQNRVTALEDINLSIGKGEYLSVLGPSGAGKSTLIHILAGLEATTQGAIFFDGQNIASFGRKQLLNFRNQKVGFVFQFYHLIEELTVLENIILPYKLNRERNKEKPASVYQRAIAISEQLDLGERIGFYPSQLSGGEQQRAALARAIINRPQILFCDEPTGNLDPESSGKIKSLLAKINKEKGTTIVIVTHNLELAKDSQRVLNIKKGKLINNSIK